MFRHAPTLSAHWPLLLDTALFDTHTHRTYSDSTPRTLYTTALQVWNFIDANPLTTQATPGHFRDNGYLSLGLGKTFHENGGAWNADKYVLLTYLQQVFHK